MELAGRSAAGRWISQDWSGPDAGNWMLRAGTTNGDLAGIKDTDGDGNVRLGINDGIVVDWGKEKERKCRR